jgi:hypothetical protein
MAMGIDSLVEAKKDIYANNPEELQKRAQISGDLLDALAMQKLLTEKQAAKNQLAMAMESNPKTIVEQNENAARQNSLSEVMQGVSGVLGQQEQERQQNLAQAGQTKQPQSTGIMDQPRPNMQGFAKGGIVGYAPGGGVETSREEDLEEYKRNSQLKAQRDRYYLIDSMKEAFDQEKAREDSLSTPQLSSELKLRKTKPIEGSNYPGLPHRQSPNFTPPKPDGTPKEETGLPSVNPNSNYEAEMDRLMAVLSAGYGNFGKANARYKQAAKQAAINAEQRAIDNEVSRTDLDIKKEANRLKDTYYKELIRERGINNANKQLTKLTEQYQEGLESSPAYSLVREAQARFRVLEEDSTYGPFEINREGKLRAQQEKINAAINYAQQQYAAGEGKEITTRLAALKATLAEYEGNRGFTVKR